MQQKLIVLNFHFTNVSGMNSVQLSYGKMFKNCVELAHFNLKKQIFFLSFYLISTLFRNAQGWTSSLFLVNDAWIQM